MVVTFSRYLEPSPLPAVVRPLMNRSRALRVGPVIHPLQFASAMLVFMFATWLFAGMQFFSQQQLSKQRVRPAIQIAVVPM